MKRVLPAGGRFLAPRQGIPSGCSGGREATEGSGLRLALLRLRTSAATGFSQVFILLLLPLLAGCETVQRYSLTYRLWDTSDLTKFSEPVPVPHLALFEATNHADVVVQYDAWSETRPEARGRAYYLSRNQQRVAAGKEPRWIKPPLPEDLRPIPVLEAESPGTNLAVRAGPYAVVAPDGKSFKLGGSGRVSESFDLPVYPESSGTAMRVALTPFAVAGDTVMVAGVAAVVGFIVWVQSGAPL